ncbi:MAG: acylphosphatase [Thermoanaerobaculia bacterium]
MTAETRGFRVRGRVQGVGFRWFVARAARDLDLCGWVANRPDGSVEIVARGAAAALAALAARLAVGPPAARVAGVDEFPAELDPGRSGFDIA